MTRRIPQALALAALAATTAACEQDMPTEAQTVQLAIVPGAHHGGAPLRTDMTQELTATVTGDPDGYGHALITINVGQKEACWDLSAANIALPATASHIHRAAPGLSGGVVVGLSAPNTAGTAAGCRTVDDRELLKEILMNPERFYVNVHTSEFPAGAIRGQLGD